MGGGGGSGSSTTTSQLDPQIKAAVLPAIQRASRMYGQGTFDAIADSAALREALGLQKDFARGIAEKGLGQENLLNELRNTEGKLLTQQQGALGSARGDRAREAALSDRALQLSQADAEAKRRAYADIVGSDQGIYDISQFEVEAPLRGTERFLGVLAGSPAGHTETTKTKGGGK